MTIRAPSSSPAAATDPMAVGLGALGWVLQDEDRAERLLTLTGLTPDALRAGLREPAVIGAVLEFLANHEPDLIGAAEALDVAPATLAAAAQELSA